MKTNKKVIQRSLPLDTTYTLVSSHYSELENGTSCDNCGKLIANIAIVQDTKRNVEYAVGMDCASTLSGIKDTFDFEYVHKANFSQAKQARAKVMKFLKEKPEGKVIIKTSNDTNNFYKEVGAGVIFYEEYRNGEFNGRTWKQYPVEIWSKYVLPMIKDLPVTIATSDFK